jgi:mycofactocin precursor
MLVSVGQTVWAVLTDITYERKDEMKQQEKECQPSKKEELKGDVTDILEEIEVEDLTVDGICGVY